MKKILIVLATAWLAGCGDSDAGKTKDATAFFKPHFEKVYSAWSTLDASKPSMFYAKDPGLAFFDISPLKYRGWQEYEDGSKKTFANWKSIQLTVGPDFHATQAGNIAWATYTLDFAIAPQTGDVIKAQARGTDILEKRGEEWLIIHEHVSVPMADQQPTVAKKAKAAPHHKAKKKH
jgi:ketosteroid isomerase-like protein